jgi:hypothetical protein
VRPSRHYAADAVATFERAHCVLAPGGTLVVMDSPIFRADGDGSAMVGVRLQCFMCEGGRCDVVQRGAGNLTLARLACIAGKLALRPPFLLSRGSLGWRLRGSIARARPRRAPAAFGLSVAR